MKHFLIPEATYHRLKNRQQKHAQQQPHKNDQQDYQPPIEHQDEDDSFILDAFPKKTKDRVERLINYIRRHDPVINWSSNGHVTINNTPLEGSNIIDLLRAAVNGVQKKPVGWYEFMQALKDINTPMTLITLAPPGVPIKRPRWLTH